jgi:hypothetical protein
MLSKAIHSIFKLWMREHVAHPHVIPQDIHSYQLLLLLTVHTSSKEHQIK